MCFLKFVCLFVYVSVCLCLRVFVYVVCLFIVVGVIVNVCEYICLCGWCVHVDVFNRLSLCLYVCACVYVRSYFGIYASPFLRTCTPYLPAYLRYICICHVIVCVCESFCTSSRFCKCHHMFFL